MCYDYQLLEMTRCVSKHTVHLLLEFFFHRCFTASVVAASMDAMYNFGHGNIYPFLSILRVFNQKSLHTRKLLPSTVKQKDKALDFLRLAELFHFASATATAV